MIWRTRGHGQQNVKRGSIDLTSEAVIMGILNVTPDSFSDGGDSYSIELAIQRASEIRSEGAKIIDIGGESTRPGADPVSADEEMKRVVPVIEALRNLAEFDDVWISVDTTKSAVAEAAIQAGADIVNDVSGCTSDPEMVALCAREGVGVVVMHMQGTPETMQNNPSYEDVRREVQSYFSERFDVLTSVGVDEECICFDPGIGFGKTDAHNLQLLKSIDMMTVYSRPVLLGVSRKSLFGRLLEINEPKDRDAATVAITALARQNGCMLHRVHDVKGNLDAVKMAECLKAISR